MTESSAATAIENSPASGVNVVEWLLRAAQVCEAAKRGDMEARLLGIASAFRESPSPELERLLYGINDLIDVVDAFVRESKVSLEYASDEKFFRRLLENGLFGSYRNAARSINEATAAMEKKSAALTAAESERRTLSTSLAESARGLGSTASSLQGIAGRTSTLADEVAERSNSTSRDVEGVAAAAEQFTSTVASVQDLVSRSDGIIQAAVADLDRAQQQVTDLSEKAHQINSVSQMIQQITRTTALLSLNASIEAARAGDWGRGFAVVAQEVKSLASETSAAAKDIMLGISGVQHATINVVDVIELISRAVSQFTAISNKIEVAVREQQTATELIHDGVQRAACSTQDVSTAIAQVAESAQDTNELATRVLDSSEELNEQADRMAGDTDELPT